LLHCIENAKRYFDISGKEVSAVLTGVSDTTGINNAGNNELKFYG